MDMKTYIRCILNYLFISMLYSKIKIKIDINKDELLKTIWEHMRELKGYIIKLINFHILSHYSYLIFTFSRCISLSKYNVHFINPKLFPWPGVLVS